MKKPKKPKVNRQRSDVYRAAKPELGAAALTFLARRPSTKAHKTTARRWLGRGVHTRGLDALGPAARAFVHRARAGRIASPSTGSLGGLSDQRETLALLLMPALMLAFALAMGHTWTHPTRLAKPELARTQMVDLAPWPAAETTLPLAPELLHRPAAVAAAIDDIPLLPADPPVAQALELPETRLLQPSQTLPAEPPATAAPGMLPDAATQPEETLLSPQALLPQAPPHLSLPANIGVTRACQAKPGFGLHSYSAHTPQPGETVGDRLAAAARAQTDEFVIYNGRYRAIAYPMGDVPPLFGVCTDVIVRAYRAIGIDLQELVRRAGIGSGDTNIDHRRTETLRRFFARRGETLPITSFPEDYQPGDIVTYHRPQNRRTQSHIAIVSDVLAPSGRPMIVHNRGWGPQLEDALFVDRITGHYRFQPAPAIGEIAAAARNPATKSMSMPPRPSRPATTASIDKTALLEPEADVAVEATPR